MRNNAVLAVYDVRGIQEFVFRTNRLREITGASRIIQGIFDEAMEHVIQKLRWANCKCLTNWENLTGFAFESDDSIILERLYTAAGNTYIAFCDEDHCLAFNKIVSRYIFEHTYSLNLAIAFVPITSDNYPETYRALAQALGDTKAKMPMTRLTSAFPIVRQDSNTGYPLVGTECTESRLKIKSYKEEIEEIKKDATPESLGYEKLLDNMVSEKGVDSHIAIVHIDGNNLGKTFGEKMRTQADPGFTASVATLRSLSKEVDASFRQALAKTEEASKKFIASDECPFKNKERLYYRRVICAGDDITFICNARMALSLAEIFLENLKEGFTACAGIAIINSHFPFAAGYQLAEQCCASAKKRAKELPEESAGNYIDFQICRDATTAYDLERARAAHYSRDAGETWLLSRPYCVGSRKDKHHFNTFKNAHRHFAQPAYARSTSKELRNAYAEGQHEAEEFHAKMKWRGKKLPYGEALFLNPDTALGVPLVPDVPSVPNEALFYDALEKLDLFIDVKAALAAGADTGSAAAAAGSASGAATTELEGESDGTTTNNSAQ
jgi:hypothetical protein